jgi:ketosteroid isomerase-like protein
VAISAESAIQALIDNETAARDRLDADTLVSLFHPDTLWPSPASPTAHDPLPWIMPLGRFDRERWKKGWLELFRMHDLLHNHRHTLRIVSSEQNDGGFAVVDVDTLWRDRASQQLSHWKGRACKVYSKVGDRWYFLIQVGLLDCEPALHH